MSSTRKETRMTRDIRMPGPGGKAIDGYGPKTLARAIQWIALNDESAEHDPEVMAEVPSVLCIADLFDKDPLDVARAVVRWRGVRL